MFIELKMEEKQAIEGGVTAVSISGAGVSDIISGIVSAYMAVREIARDAGRNAAYRDLGY